MNKIKYIIFDFDGTLADSKDLGIALINKLADKYHFKRIEEDNYEILLKLSIVDRCKYLNIPLFKIPFWAAEFYNLFKHSMSKLHLFPGIKELLDELHQRGYQLAVISSNSESNIREFFARNHLDYIKQIICSSKIFGKDKMIKNFLENNKLKNSEVIYVGDEHRDIVACKVNQVKVIWVEWGFDLKEMVEREQPDYIVHSPEQILAVV